MYLLGMDGGGTSCRAALCNLDGKVLGIGKSGATNIASNPEGAYLNIIKATHAAFSCANVSNNYIADSFAVLGLAGVNLGNYAERMVNSIKNNLPFRQCKVETDARIALQGALGNAEGIVGAIGTGSVFIVRYDSKIRSIGGWGFMVSDLGSGARIGRALLQEILLVCDGVHHSSELTKAILSTFNEDPQAIAEYARTASPGNFAKFCPQIFAYAKNEDPIAKILIKQTIADIEETLSAMMPKIPIPLCLLGGIGKRCQPFLSPFFQRLIRAPLGTGLDGAIGLAVHHFGSKKIHHGSSSDE